MHTPFRIYHGPMNTAGLGGLLARWQRAQGHVSEHIVWSENPFCPNSDLDLDLESYPSRLRRSLIAMGLFLFALPRYDIFHFYFGKSFLPWNLDMPLLRLFGKKIVMTYCGSDIRLIEIERKRNVHHQFIHSGLDDPQHDRSKQRMMRWQSRWVHRFTAPKAINAPALSCIPAAKVRGDILINHVNFDLSVETPPYVPNEVPLIVHAPTNADIKGTQYVLEAIETLRGEGLQFRFELLQGKQHAEILDSLRDKADIVVDQVLLGGGFGHFASEAMFHRRPVLGYVLDDIQALFPDCPVVNCTIWTLADQLRDMLGDPAKRIRLGEQGHAFVTRHMDSEVIQRQIIDLYAEISGGDV